MMAAYQPTPGVHPGLQHGHPGMAPNQGQHMGQPMQMHPGVSGAPHVSQPGAMMGMQPGAGGMGPGGMGGQHPGAGMAMQAQMGGQTMAGGAPNAQAMSHMTPQQMQQQQAQQAHMAAQMQANPQFALQQYQIRQRQAQMMHQQQQQQQANGMMNMQQQGMQLTPAQIAQLQQNQQQAMQGGGQVQLPPHMQQQLLLRQQQVAAQQHAQAQQQAAQQNQMAQQMAMQHANSQQSNQGQPGPPNPQPAQGQPQNHPQGRPPSRIANPNEQGQQASQPQQHAQQQGQANQPQPQQAAQPGQQANVAQQQQQQQQQQQAQQAQQVQQAQQAQQQQQMTPQQQMNQMQRQQHLQMLQRQQTIRQMQAQAQGQAQQQQAAQGGMFILRLMNFSDHLSNFGGSNGKDMATWHSFVDRHFAADGRLVHSFDDGSNSGGNGRGKIFEVLRPTLPRYFCTYFESGASALRLHTEHAREVPQGNGTHLVTCQTATLSISYPNGTRLDMSGSLHVLFSAGNDTIECFQFATTGTEETLTRAQIEKTIAEHSPTLPIKASPKMTKNKLPKAQQKMQDQQDRLTIDHFPKTPKGTIGITSKVQQFLEIGETMNVMSDLMHYSQEKKLRPDQALEALVAQYDSQAGNPQINLPPNGMQAGNRTPSMQNMQMPQNGQPGAFSSPSVSNLNLPMQNGMNGSPHLGNPGNLGAPNMSMPISHTPSPHQSNMAAPMMMPQHSQQGTNSSAASANTSPNVNNNNNNKRRRSTVKLEGDEPDAMSNANRVKPSPRMTKKSKPQG